MLTAPLASPNSHLLVCTQSEEGGPCFLFDWLIGSDSWSKLELNLNDSWILQIVEFNCQFIAVGSDHRLYTLSLVPQLGLQEIATDWWGNMNEWPFAQWPFAQRRLVVCSGMLLIVDDYLSDSTSGTRANYKTYRLDMSTEPPTFEEVVKLENDALFIGVDARSPPFSCPSPGRWRGRSNCVYRAHHSHPWVLHGLGDDADAVWDDSTGLEVSRRWDIELQPFWVYPSMLFSDGQ